MKLWVNPTDVQSAEFKNLSITLFGSQTVTVEVEFPLRCIGIKFVMPENLNFTVGNLSVQPFSGSLSSVEKRDEVYYQISRMRSARNDEQFMPKWDAFFERLAASIKDSYPIHTAVLQELSKKGSGPVQLPVSRPYNVILYEHDVVAPVVLRGSDMPIAALRRELLEARTENLNLKHLLGAKQA